MVIFKSKVGQTFSVKEQVVDISGFAVPMVSYRTNECGNVLMKLYLQNKAAA